MGNGLRSLRETAQFPQYVYEMVGAPNFAAMATPAVAQQFADLFRAKLQDIETQSRALIATHADERGQLLRLATNLSEMVEANLQSLLREKARSEDMMIQQAERNFGHNVNEGSFKWMLVIFGIAFVVLFIVPYLYRDLDAASIPGQILTSNFILQFCTVFILTALHRAARDRSLHRDGSAAGPARRNLRLRARPARPQPARQRGAGGEDVAASAAASPAAGLASGALPFASATAPAMLACASATSVAPLAKAASDAAAMIA